MNENAYLSACTGLQKAPSYSDQAVRGGSQDQDPNRVALSEPSSDIFLAVRMGLRSSPNWMGSLRRVSIRQLFIP